MQWAQPTEAWAETESESETSKTAGEEVRARASWIT